METPKGAPEPLGYVGVQPRHTQKCENTARGPQPNQGEGLLTAAQTSLPSETV
jgi:hypothetical protein